MAHVVTHFHSLKKKIIVSVFALPAVFIFAGCSFMFDWLFHEIENISVTAEDLTSYEDEPDSAYFYTLNNEENSITLTNVKGKYIFYANYNPTGSAISQSNLRYISSSKNISTKTIDLLANPIYTYSGSGGGSTYTPGKKRQTSSLSADEQDEASSELSIEKELELGGMQIHKCSARLFEPLEIKADSSARTVSARAGSSGDSISASNFEVDTSTKEIYVDNNSSISSFEQKSATLRAKNDVCLVWVVDENYAETGDSTGEKITSAVAKSIAANFANHYENEREIFGEEGEYLINSGVVDTKEMKYTSKTGNLVNIVIYDIGADYNANTQCGVVGYFYSKDYFYKSNYGAQQYSNEGKYFYIDAPYCNFVSDSDFSGTGDVSKTVMTTLFHEFQHMINFNVKYVEQSLSSPTWYNEMLSMLAEDMMSSALNLGTSDTAAGARFPAFNEYYYCSGIDTYRDDDYAVLSYSTAYTFGAWLSREYGGPEFVSAMSKNNSVGLDSIVSAIKENNGTTVSKLQLHKKFIQACVFRDDNSFASNKGLPTLNKDAGGSLTLNNSGTSYTYKMSALDLFSKDYGYTVDSKNITGPFILANKATITLSSGGTVIYSSLLPHSFLVKFAGKATGDTITLNFSTQNASGEQVLIFVQDAFTNYQ